MKFQKTLNVRSAGLDSKVLDKLVAENPNDELPVLVVYGEITGQTEANGINGPVTVYTGTFEAKNLLNEEFIRADRMILPDMAMLCLKTLVGTITDSHGNISGAARFGINITVSKNHSDKKSAYEYVWGATPLVEIEVKDVLTDMRNEFTKMLPKPKNQVKNT